MSAEVMAAGSGHWSRQRELAASDAPIRLTAALVKHLPFPLLACLVYPVSFFYYTFAPRAHREALRYQRQLLSYGGSSLRRPHAYRQVASFAYELMQKVCAWSGRAGLEEIIFHDDDVAALKAQLAQGRGAMLLSSHLGNMELLRCLASRGETGVGRQVPVTVVMDMRTTSHFNSAMAAMNGRFCLDVIPADGIGVDSMERMQDCLARGGLVVLAGDRTSPSHPGRSIRERFLGKEAPFPYGSFMLAALLKVPVYFVFALREAGSPFVPRYSMFVTRAGVDFDCPRREREGRVRELCGQFVRELERRCTAYPYQWYNFFDFWLFSEEGGLHEQHDAP